MEWQPVCCRAARHAHFLPGICAAPPSCLIIYPWYDHLPHYFISQTQRRRQPGRVGGNKGRGIEKRNPSLLFRGKLHFLFLMWFHRFTQRAQTPVFAQCMNIHKATVVICLVLQIRSQAAMMTNRKALSWNAKFAPGNTTVILLRATYCQQKLQHFNFAFQAFNAHRPKYWTSR